MRLQTRIRLTVGKQGKRQSVCIGFGPFPLLCWIERQDLDTLESNLKFKAFYPATMTVERVTEHIGRFIDLSATPMPDWSPSGWWYHEAVWVGREGLFIVAEQCGGIDC